MLIFSVFFLLVTDSLAFFTPGNALNAYCPYLPAVATLLYLFLLMNTDTRLRPTLNALWTSVLLFLLTIPAVVLGSGLSCADVVYNMSGLTIRRIGTSPDLLNFLLSLPRADEIRGLLEEISLRASSADEARFEFYKELARLDRTPEAQLIDCLSTVGEYGLPVVITILAILGADADVPLRVGRLVYPQGMDAILPPPRRVDPDMVMAFASTKLVLGSGGPYLPGGAHPLPFFEAERLARRQAYEQMLRLHEDQQLLELQNWISTVVENISL